MSLTLSRPPVMRAAVLVRRPAAEVFRAFTDPEVTTRFWFTDSTGPLAPGAEVTWRWSMFDVEAPVRVIEFEPPRRLVMDWGNEGGPLTRVEWTFTEQESGTRVEVVESGYTGSGDDVVARLADSTSGFTQVLVAAKALLEHGVVVDVMGDRGAMPELPPPDLAERPHQLVVEHELHVPPADVYRAWTEGFDTWFAEPGLVLMRASVGEPFVFVTRHDDRLQPHHGRFLALEPERRVELTWVTGRDGTAGAETVVTVELRPGAAGGTLLRLTHAGFYDEAGVERHRDAWATVVLPHLDAVLSGART